MTNIKVTPENLLTSSVNISQTAPSISGVGSTLVSVGNGAPSYDGQFGNVIRGICSEARSQAGNYSTRVTSVSTLLSKKANAFAAADQRSSESILNTVKVAQSKTVPIPPYSITEISQTEIARVQRLGNLNNMVEVVGYADAGVGTAINVGAWVTHPSMKILPAKSLPIAEKIGTGVGAIFLAVGIGLKWERDIAEYQNYGKKYVQAAMLFDAMMAIGAFLGTMAITALIAAIPGIGAPMAAILGGIIGTIISTLIEQHVNSEGRREKAIDALANNKFLNTLFKGIVSPLLGGVIDGYSSIRLNAIGINY